MKLISWIKSKLLLRKKNDEEISVSALKKEIEKLKKENKLLREKIIIFLRKSNEKILVNFFDEKIEDVIIKNIREAKKELYVAVAWFTSKTLMEELSRLKRRGVNIKLIISDQENNFRNNNEIKLMNACSEMKMVSVPKSGNRKYNNLMHNKYCIIDNKKVIDGSYNWSNNAKYNLEHVVVIESRTVAKMYKDNFYKIYNNPEYYKDYNIYSELG